MSDTVTFANATREQLKQQTAKDLRALIRKHKVHIRGFSTMKKDALVNNILRTRKRVSIRKKEKLDDIIRSERLEQAEAKRLRDEQPIRRLSPKVKPVPVVIPKEKVEELEPEDTIKELLQDKPDLRRKFGTSGLHLPSKEYLSAMALALGGSYLYNKESTVPEIPDDIELQTFNEFTPDDSPPPSSGGGFGNIADDISNMSKEDKRTWKQVLNLARSSGMSIKDAWFSVNAPSTIGTSTFSGSQIVRNESPSVLTIDDDDGAGVGGFIHPLEVENRTELIDDIINSMIDTAFKRGEKNIKTRKTKPNNKLNKQIRAAGDRIIELQRRIDESNIPVHKKPKGKAAKRKRRTNTQITTDLRKKMKDRSKSK